MRNMWTSQPPLHVRLNQGCHQDVKLPDKYYKIGREANSEGFLLVLLFLYFLVKVARNHIHHSHEKSLLYLHEKKDSKCTVM